MRGRTNDGGFSCDKCGEPAVSFPHTVTYGQWDEESSNYRNPAPLRRRYCESCWYDEFTKQSACYWELGVGDGARVYDVLSASGGALVADTYALTIGGRGYTRVVDGVVEGVAIGREAHSNPNELEFYPYAVDVDREWVEEMFEGHDSSSGSSSGSDTGGDTGSDTGGDTGSDAPPRIVLLRPVEDTPFGEPDCIEPCHRDDRDGDGSSVPTWVGR